MLSCSCSHYIAESIRALSWLNALSWQSFHMYLEFLHVRAVGGFVIVAKFAINFLYQEAASKKDLSLSSV